MIEHIEQLGKRIARLRARQSWTQQALAERLAISRVAVSHLEMDLSVPSERTVTLLAGLFKLEPHELVEGTSYPQAKAERLPLVACRHTEMELQLALLRNDLAWLAFSRERAPGIDATSLVMRRWQARLDALAAGACYSWERESIAEARRNLRRAIDGCTIEEAG